MTAFNFKENRKNWLLLSVSRSQKYVELGHSMSMFAEDG